MEHRVKRMVGRMAGFKDENASARRQQQEGAQRVVTTPARHDGAASAPPTPSAAILQARRRRALLKCHTQVGGASNQGTIRPQSTAAVSRRVSRLARHLQASCLAPAPTSATTSQGSTRTQVYIPGRSVDVHASCDVLVVGGGPAGLSAALGARRAGADVMLVERFGCFGGVITTVGMETMGWYRYEGTDDCEGIGREMERVAARMGGSTKWPYNNSDCLDAERFKVVADTLVREAGIRPLLHSWVVDVVMSPDKAAISGVVIECKSGRRVILASRVVDCTGDADVAHLCGCPTTRAPASRRMGVTTVFSAAGVDNEKFLEHVHRNPRTYADWSTQEWKQETTGKEDVLRSPFLDTEFNKAAADGVISKSHADSLVGSWSALSEAGEATNLNLVHLPGSQYDALDVDDLTRAEMEGRERTMVAIKALKHTLPGFEKAKLRNFGMTIGVRDTRKIVGKYNLTSDDVRNQARFSDSIGIFPEFIDGYNILILPSTGRYFQVPLRCMQPLRVDNLLVAGRCVAGDIISHAAMRNMMACTVTGQGAGVAAAVSLIDGVPTSNVNPKHVQEELLRQKVRLE